MIDILHPQGIEYKLIKDLTTELPQEQGIDRIVQKFQPKTILELGSWMGKSAITFGNECMANDIDANIVCVDTWLGSHEYWTTYTERLPMVAKSYDAFVSNVVANGLEGTIIPFRQTTKNAMNIFKHHGIKFDLIYWDSDHASVYDDLQMASKVISCKGVIVVDDYFQHQQVKQQVDKFTKEHKHKTQTINDKVIIRTDKK